MSEHPAKRQAREESETAHPIDTDGMARIILTPEWAWDTTLRTRRYNYSRIPPSSEVRSAILKAVMDGVDNIIVAECLPQDAIRIALRGFAVRVLHLVQEQPIFDPQVWRNLSGTALTGQIRTLPLWFREALEKKTRVSLEISWRMDDV